MNNYRTIKSHFIGLSFLAMCLCFFSCLNVVSAETRPESILENATKSMLSSLKENRQTLKQNPNRIYSIVDEVLVPHVDTEYMAKWVIGKQYWTSANADQQRRFIEEFKKMVVRSYASSLLAY